MSALEDFLGAETKEELQKEIKSLILDLIRDEYDHTRRDLLSWCDLGSLCDDILGEVCDEVKNELKKSIKTMLRKEMQVVLREKAENFCEEV